MSAEVIEEIGKYRIIGELGHGGMGMVYLAEDKNLGRQVALKVLLGSFASDELFKQRFRQEARSISQVVHPNIVQIHSMDEIDSHLVIDIEYVEGQPLSQIIQHHPVSLEWVAHIAKDVLEGLSVCHEIGIVHRDIKPSNVLMTLNGQAKIADFGIAKALADSSAMSIEDTHSTTVFMGTPRFTPPEAWDGVPANPSWDLYSLGILLYEALTRRPAFKSTTMLSLMKEVVSESLEPIESRVEGISSEFASLINDLVKVSPKERVQSAQDALDRLAGAREVRDGMFLEDNTVTIPIPKPLTQSLTSQAGGETRVVESKRGSIVPLLLLIILVVGTLVIFLMPDSSAPAPNSLSSDLITLNDSPVWWATSLREDGGQGWQVLWDIQSEVAQTKVYAYHDQVIMTLTATRSGERILLDGDWAGYRTINGTGIVSGDVSGTGIVHEGNESMTLTLEFRNERDHSEWEEVFLMEHDPVRNVHADFVRGIEISDWLPSLFQNEVSPRMLPVGIEIDSLLPWADNQRVMVPKIQSDEAPVINGVLDEEIWKESYFHGEIGRIGELNSVNNILKDLLHVRHDGEQLYFSLQTKNNEVSELGIDFSIRQLVSKPASKSLRGELTLSNHESFTLKNYRGLVEEPFRKPWTTASSVKDGYWVAEWSVPLHEVVSLDESGRVRVVLMLWERDENGEKRTVAYWGDDDVKKVAHGALLIPTQK